MKNQKFSLRELQKKVEQAVSDFMRKDSTLLKLRAHEQAISHRVAYYLENLFCESDREKLNVDCEYNKHLGVCKKSNIDLEEYKNEYKNCDCNSCKQLQNIEPLPKEKRFRPDVLVHSRGDDGGNLIAIEIKKDKICPFDKAKLKALTRLKEAGGSYGYQLGLFLYFPNGKPEFLWFPDESMKDTATVVRVRVR